MRQPFVLSRCSKLTASTSDFTAATILDEFRNQATASAVERVLKAMSTKRAKEIMEVSLS